jgi:hypothetical protein
MATAVAGQIVSVMGRESSKDINDPPPHFLGGILLLVEFRRPAARPVFVVFGHLYGRCSEKGEGGSDVD